MLRRGGGRTVPCFVGVCAVTAVVLGGNERPVSALRVGFPFHSIKQITRSGNQTPNTRFTKCSGSYYHQLYAGEQGQEQEQEQEQEQRPPKRRREADQQSPTLPESRCPRPVDGPLKRRKKLDQPVLAAPRVDRVAATRETAAISTPVLAATMPRQPHHQQPDLALFSCLTPNIGDDVGGVSRPLFSSRSSVGLGGAGAGGGGIDVGVRGVAAPGLFARANSGVGSGGWQGRDGSSQPAGLSQGGGDNDTSPGNNRNSSTEGASRGGSQIGDIASAVDWQSMYGPSGSFIGSLPPTVGVNTLLAWFLK